MISIYFVFFENDGVYFYIYFLKEGFWVFIYCFVDFKLFEDKVQCWKWKKNQFVYICIQVKKILYYRGLIVNVKGKSVRVYWKIFCCEDI